MIIITKRQKQLLELGIEKGVLTIEDFFDFYKSEQARKNAIQRLIEGEYIVRTEVGMFYVLTENFIVEDNPISKCECNFQKGEEFKNLSHSNPKQNDKNNNK